MLRPAAWLVALAALALAACGRDPAPEWPPAAPALWEISDGNGVQGWLFGTVHSLPDGVTWETPVLARALGQAGVLVVEVKDLADDAAGAHAFARRAYSPGLPPLTRRVPPETRPALAALLARAGRSEADFATMESWAAALALAGTGRVGDPDLGVDRALLARGLPAVELEGFDNQFAIFDSLPESEQADLLRAVAEEAVQPDPHQAIVDWLEGDLAALEQSGEDGLLDDPELRAALLDGRNRVWADRIGALVNQGRRPFVAVGAAHMLGEGGLPELLAARGLAVRRIQ